MLDFSGEEYEDGVKAYHETPGYYYSNKIGKPEKAFGKNHDQYRNWQINQPLFDGKASGNGCQKRKAVLLIIWQKKCSLDGVCRIKEIARIGDGRKTKAVL